MESLELNAGMLIVDEDDVPAAVFSGDQAMRDVLTSDDGAAVPLSCSVGRVANTPGPFCSSLWEPERRRCS